ncbi:MAG: hypothetical protein JNG84_10410, partial [Archangium sp.]|nr:hypothetical protein [Archangium sp.]
MPSVESHARHAGATVAPDFRSTVAAAAKRFKSSWVELGKLLVQVNNEALFQEWGYP